MTVAELMEKLAAMPQDAEVLMEGSDGYARVGVVEVADYMSDLPVMLRMHEDDR